MSELNLDHSDLGSVGSSVFLGLTFGASIAGYIFNYISPKWIISSSIILTCLSLYLKECDLILNDIIVSRNR